MILIKNSEYFLCASFVFTGYAAEALFFAFNFKTCGLQAIESPVCFNVEVLAEFFKF